MKLCWYKRKGFFSTIRCPPPPVYLQWLILCEQMGAIAPAQLATVHVGSEVSVYTLACECCYGSAVWPIDKRLG